MWYLIVTMILVSGEVREFKQQQPSYATCTQSRDSLKVGALSNFAAVARCEHIKG